MPWMDSSSIIGMIAMGSFITIVYAEYRHVPNSVRWLKRMFPGRGAGWYSRADFLLTWFSSTIVAYLLFHPTDADQAFFAGLGSVSAIRVALSKSEGETGINRTEGKNVKR
jgi:hypothetical protein